MSTATLGSFLERIADLMESAEAKATLVRDVRNLATKLRPFVDQSLAQFGDFLVKAEAYSRGELAGVLKTTKAKSGSARSASDPNRVSLAIERLKMLYSRGLDPSVNHEAIASEIDAISRYTKADLDEIARGCGFSQRFATKAKVLEAIDKWIRDRRSSYDRAHV